MPHPLLQRAQRDTGGGHLRSKRVAQIMKPLLTEASSPAVSTECRGACVPARHPNRMSPGSEDHGPVVLDADHGRRDAHGLGGLQPRPTTHWRVPATGYNGYSRSFSAPAKRFRAEHRPASCRTAISTDSFVLSDGRAVLHKSSRTPRAAVDARKVVDMQTTPTRAPRRRNPASSLLSALRGDKHMVGAYRSTRDPALGDRPSVALEPSAMVHASPASATRDAD
jgi:hypothetical protein